MRVEGRVEDSRFRVGFRAQVVGLRVHLHAALLARDAEEQLEEASEGGSLR